LYNARALPPPLLKFSKSANSSWATLAETRGRLFEYV
jgi:hypothetical protein